MPCAAFTDGFWTFGLRTSVQNRYFTRVSKTTLQRRIQPLAEERTPSSRTDQRCARSFQDRGRTAHAVPQRLLARRHGAWGRICGGDERRLAQVLLNLVGNAIKFTDKGEVAIRASVANGAFTVAVCDTGAGIAAADQRILVIEDQADNRQAHMDLRRRVCSYRTGGSGFHAAVTRPTRNRRQPGMKGFLRVGPDAHSFA